MSEYLILVLLIAVGSIAATKSLGGTVERKIKEIRGQIEGVNFAGSHRGSRPNGDSSLENKVDGDVGSVLESFFGNHH